MTLSEFRRQTHAIPRRTVRRAIATALMGRTLRTQREFSDFYDAVCRELEQIQGDAVDELVA